MSGIFNQKFLLPLSLLGTFTGGSILLRDSFRGGKCRSQARLDGKTVVITGANTGLGKATAINLAKRGGRIILACRDEKKAIAARKDIILQSGNTNVVVRDLNLASFSSIREFANKINKEEEHIDILINNAGVMRCPFQKSEDGYEMQMAVNHLGPFLLTNLLLEKLKASEQSRIVNVSCIAYLKGRMNLEKFLPDKEEDYVSNTSYSNSKLAMVLFNIGLHKRLQGTGVTANVLHPGICKTEIGRHTGGAHQKGFSKIILGPIFYFFVKQPHEGCQTIVHCAVSEELDDVSGKFFIDCEEKSLQMIELDEQVEQLWKWSQRKVGLIELTSETS